MTSGGFGDLTVFGPRKTELTQSGEAFLNRLEHVRQRTASPFSSERQDLVARVGENLLRGAASAEGAVRHFGFWIRRGAVRKLAASFHARLPAQTKARARGLVFHLPPHNVETVFLYSWALSYLAGNANVTRLPQQLSQTMRDVCNLFLDELRAVGDDTQLFIHYLSTSDLGALISKSSDARVVWGGDAKVAAFAPLPLRHGGKSIWFGDRSSFSVLKGAALHELDGGGRSALAQKLFNDIFAFDQMACSSPHILYVVGDENTHQSAVEPLLRSLAHLATASGRASETGHFMRKMVAAQQAAATGAASAIDWRDVSLTSVVLSASGRPEARIGGGFLWIVYIPATSSLRAFASERDQTVTHFGFEPEEVADVAETVAHSGVSRFAPVGSALDFDFVWDGYDIPFELTRLVRVA